MPILNCDFLRLPEFERSGHAEGEWLIRICKCLSNVIREYTEY